MNRLAFGADCRFSGTVTYDPELSHFLYAQYASPSHEIRSDADLAVALPQTRRRATSPSPTHHAILEHMVRVVLLEECRIEALKTHIPGIQKTSVATGNGLSASKRSCLSPSISMRLI